jgi:hypothetical protein
VADLQNSFAAKACGGLTSVNTYPHAKEAITKLNIYIVLRGMFIICSHHLAVQNISSIVIVLPFFKRKYGSVWP